MLELISPEEIDELSSVLNPWKSDHKSPAYRYFYRLENTEESSYIHNITNWKPDISFKLNGEQYTIRYSLQAPEEKYLVSMTKI